MNTQFLKFLFGIIFALLFLTVTSAQEASLSEAVTNEKKKNIPLLGDDFNLYSALEAFKRSETLDQFQSALNTEPWFINNLDLNNDQLVDYLTIHDITEAGVHNIVISAHINGEQQQDIAVIEVIKTGTEEAILQIVGHEEFYGKNMVVESFETIKSREKGSTSMEQKSKKVVTNVWDWSVVPPLFSSSYSPYRSKQNWGRYHRGYKAWAPKNRKTWSEKEDMFSKNYYITPIRRSENARSIYEPYRLSSELFEEQNQAAIAAARSQSVDVADVDVAVVDGMVRKKKKSIEYINSDGRVIRTGGDQTSQPAERSPERKAAIETPYELLKRLEKEKAQKKKKKDN